MNIVLINGSPRANGCTHRALEEVQKSLKAAGVGSEIIQASLDKPTIKEISEKVLNSNGLVVGSPVYYASASGLCTSFLDELFNIISGKVRFKVAAAVTSSRRGGASATFDQINKYFTISEMVVVSSNYWNEVHGNTPLEVEEDKEGLQTLRELGTNLAYVAKALEKANLPLPEKEGKVRTNFIR